MKYCYKGVFAGAPHCFNADGIRPGWNSLLGAVRQRGVLSDDLREISICRVALQNRAWFEWDQHAPLLQAAEGVTDECMHVIKAPTPTTRGPLSEKQWLVLQYSDAMTRQIEVHENLFRRLREVFNDREVVELTITCAAYNMVSRFLVALDVGELNGKPPFALE